MTNPISHQHGTVQTTNSNTIKRNRDNSACIKELSGVAGGGDGGSGATSSQETYLMDFAFHISSSSFSGFFFLYIFFMYIRFAFISFLLVWLRWDVVSALQKNTNGIWIRYIYVMYITAPACVKSIVLRWL